MPILKQRCQVMLTFDFESSQSFDVHVPTSTLERDLRSWANALKEKIERLNADHQAEHKSVVVKTSSFEVKF